ncbi:MAG: anhydro-N-acetylmuramic acid kinase [Calditrichaeota bacterium]|nr:MAG: anhydro-N-acetylmuramic acid kinase [Calditrichota bacterium]
MNRKKTVSNLYIGLMSGTSCDGLDVACVRFGEGDRPEMEVIRTGSYAYPPAIRAELLDFIREGAARFERVTVMHAALARLWAGYINDFLEKASLAARDIRAIGSHGQTIWHQPQEVNVLGMPTASTWQIGDISFLALHTGISVVGDFRPADMAVGGQGAPLIPYFDHFFFSRLQKNVVSVNVGGISNLTFIAADREASFDAGFDCGAGNMLIDAASRHYFNVPYDKDSRLARKGRVSEALLASLDKADHFRRRPVPRSTGREDYNDAFAAEIFRQVGGLSGEDVLATLTHYSALTIVDALERFILPRSPIDAVYIGGGGAANPLLMETLRRMMTPVPVESTTQLGLPADFKEATAFALYARQTLAGIPINIPSATGAREAVLCGKIYEVLS